MTDLLPVLATAFLTGVLGSAHCLGMCAGISGLFAVNAGVAGIKQQLPLALVYNGGRLISYTLLGAIVAVFGRAIAGPVPSIAGPVRLITGLIIVLIGLQVAFDLRFLAPIEKGGAKLWQKLAPMAKRFVPVNSLPRALGLGVLWGWLPCGLVYSVLLIAATTANPAAGAVTMLAFGAGTLPAMVLTGMGAAQLSILLRNRAARIGIGLLIITMGLLTAMLPISRWLT